jgi:hypothetical protein
MSETEDDLRATSDAIVTDIRRLAVLEEEKRPIDPADPRLIEVSARVVEVAARLHRESEAEHELSLDLKRRNRSH